MARTPKATNMPERPELPVFIPEYSPQEDKLPTLKQWIKKNTHEDHKFLRTVYPVQIVWAVGEYGTASVVTNEFRIGFKCSEAEFERLIRNLTAITDANYRPVCKVDRDSTPGWSITGSDKPEKGLYLDAIEVDSRIAGFRVKSGRGNDEF